ncbi:MAG: hypothetical protein M5U26_11250 [Planctomycetota bacterium]|nr:hypothetical protein [Planctomycetota bacterium]
MAEEQSEDAKLAGILVREPRYKREAYNFVREALDYTVRRRRKKGHVAGRELVEGVRDLARERFGFMAKTVLNQWGLHRTRDIGEVVFNMVEAQILSKQESDTREDFDDVFDFTAAFENDFSIELN